MNKIISIDLYNRDVMVHFGGKKELRKELKRFFHKPDANEIVDAFPENALGHTAELSGGQIVLYMPHLPMSATDWSVLQHEIFHVAFFVMDKIGITLAANCDEAYSYLIQFLTKKILEAFPISFSSDVQSA